MHYDLGLIMAEAEDLGEGHRKAVVNLKKGDTAASALSEKWVFAGPGTVTYWMHPSGWDIEPSETVKRQYV